MANDAWSVTANGFVPLSKTVNVHNNSPLHWVFRQASPQDQSVEERLSEAMACSGDAVFAFSSNPIAHWYDCKATQLKSSTIGVNLRSGYAYCDSATNSNL